MIIGDREWIAILPITQTKLAFIVCTPKAIGAFDVVERSALCSIAPTFAAFDQVVTIQYGMHRAFRWGLDHGIQPDQLLSDLRCPPAGAFFLDPNNGPFNLKGNLISASIGSPTLIGKPFQAPLFIAIKDLVASLSGDPEFPAHHGHFLAIEEAANKLNSLVHQVTLFPRHLGSPQMPNCVTYVSGIMCYLSIG